MTFNVLEPKQATRTKQITTAIVEEQEYLKGYISPKDVRRVKFKTGYETIQIPESKQIQSPQVLFKPVSIQKQPQSYKQPQLYKQPSILIQKQPVIQKEIQKPKQIERIITRIIKIPKKIIIRIPKDSVSRITKQPTRVERLAKAYQLLVKEKGKYKAVKGFGELTRGKAIQLGEKITRSTLKASFKVQPLGKLIKAREEYYRPSEQVYRSYKVKKGMKQPLVDEWIQKRKYRLGTSGELGEIQTAKRIAGTFFKSGSPKGLSRVKSKRRSWI